MTSEGTIFKTIRDVLRHAVSEFERSNVSFGQGTQSTFDEAAFLVLRTLNLPPDLLEPFLDANLTNDEIELVLRNIALRSRDKIPAPYILNEAWLRDYKFYVDERALIPRSHIADILLDQIDTWIPDPENINCALDLCTGSGCLAILLAEVFGAASVDAIDISEDALAVAQKNITNYNLQDRIKLIEGDLLTGTQKQYDLIISNPPYVDATAMKGLPEEFQKEPALALAGGDQGIDLVRQIIEKAPTNLTNDGLLIVEVGRDRVALEEAFPNIPFTWVTTQASEDSVFLLTREDLLARE
ncbi:MAG: 50S ribosomal protein L3 N(5)-glutamine methyltransferase [Betaproteobacteria bacterium]